MSAGCWRGVGGCRRGVGGCRRVRRWRVRRWRPVLACAVSGVRESVLSLGHGVIVIVGQIELTGPDDVDQCSVAPTAGRVSGRILITESVNLVALRDVTLA